MMFQEFKSCNGSLGLGRSGSPSDPIRGMPLTGRDNRLRGYVFDLSTSCGVDGGFCLGMSDEQDSECVEFLASRIGRIGSSVYRASAKDPVASDELDASRGDSVIFRTEAVALCSEGIQQQLVQTAELLLKVGVRVFVAFSEPSSSDAGFLRSFRAALYVLEDQGIEVFFVGTLSQKLGRNLRSVLERSVSGLMVSPRALGLGDKYGAYNPVKFETGVKMLSEAIHEHRKVVVMEDVKTTWQRDVLQGIPFHAFSGSISGSQVIV